MKKYIAIILALVLTFSLFVACGSKTETAKDNDPSANVAGQIDLSASVKSKTAASEIVDGGKLSLIEPFKTVEEKFKADGVNVVRGKVSKSESYIEKGDVLTKSELVIEEVFKGDLKENQTVTVRQLGGFVNSKEYADAISKDKTGEPAKSADDKLIDVRFGGFKVLEKDEKAILFLVKEKDEDVYSLLRVWQGELLFDSEAQLYVPYVPADEASLIADKAISLDDFRALADSCK